MKEGKAAVQCSAVQCSADEAQCWECNWPVMCKHVGEEERTRGKAEEGKHRKRYIQKSWETGARVSVALALL